MGFFTTILLLLVVVGAIMYAVSLYNGLVLAKTAMDKAWGNIDTFLTQRHDELPRLVDYCNTYMAPEKAAFDRVMQARDVLMNARDPIQKAKAEGAMHDSLKRLFTLSENYPKLKAQASFQQLQDRVSALETAVAERREAYNAAVKVYNLRIRSMPDVWMAKIMHLTPREIY